MIMVFEISLDYSLMPPLMLGCVIAIVVANRLEKDSIYTEPLRERAFRRPRKPRASGRRPPSASAM